MKISNVELREIKAELPSAFSGSSYQVRYRSALLCRISTDEGITGMACVGNETSYTEYLKSLVRGPFREQLIGEDPLCIERHWQRMLSFDKAYVDRPSLMMAIATIDTTLWDLKGKISNQPVWKLLGGFTDKVPMIAIGGYYETSRDEQGIRREIDKCLRMGMAGIKFKVGALSVKEDADRVRIVRAEAGPDFAIVADSNMAWTPQQAIHFARLVEEYQPAWYEEPIRPRNFIRGMRELRQKMGVRTGAGQTDVSVFNSHDLIEAEAVDIINTTYNRGGGVTGWLKLAAAASFVDIAMGQVGEPHVSMHLMGGISNSTFVECYPDRARDPLWAELYSDYPMPSGGFVILPDSPGFGLTFNNKTIERYASEAWH